MSRAGLFALAALLALHISWAKPARAFEVETLHESGPADKRYNITILGDGYRAQDQGKLEADARSITDYLLKVAPLSQYARFFNVRLVHVISHQSGADNGSAGGERDTALGSHFDCGGIDRLLCVDEGAAMSVAADDTPEFNLIVVIVNDTKYGGSGGTVCAASANEQSFEVVAHEIGHSLATLADEYSYDGGIPPCDRQHDCSEANATVRSQRDQIKWKSWLELGTPVPTPASDAYTNAIGVFEGGRYQETGTYRPKLSCRMRDLGSEFCSVCAEQFVRSFWSFENISMIESTTPPQPNVPLHSCEPVVFSVTSPPLASPTYRYTWTVDDEPRLDTNSSITVEPAGLGPGLHRVEVVVEDTTPLVRSDPNGLLKDEHLWTLDVQRSDCGPGGGAGGTPGASGGGAGGAGAANIGGAGAGGAGAAAAGGVFGGTSGAGVGMTTGGSAGAAGTSAGPERSPPPPESSGCGCRTQGSAPLAPWPLIGVFTLALARRLRDREQARERRVTQ